MDKLKELRQQNNELNIQFHNIERDIEIEILRILYTDKLLKNINWTKTTSTNDNELICWCNVSDVNFLFDIFPYDYHSSYYMTINNQMLQIGYYDSDFYIQFNYSLLPEIIKMGLDIRVIKDKILDNIKNIEIQKEILDYKISMFTNMINKVS